MIKAYIDFWKRAFDFRGRSTRPDYWWAYLVNVIIITILTVFCVRFHPAWVLLSYIGLIPILAIFSLIGSIVLLIMSCQPTKPAPETQFDKVE